MLCGLNFVERIITHFLCKPDSEVFVCVFFWRGVGGAGNSNSYVYHTVCVKNFKVK